MRDSYQCLWDTPEQTASLGTAPTTPYLSDLKNDVVIIGAGLTGLWTAHYLLQAAPSLRLTIIEKNMVGFGASGRNGGWCSSLLPMSLDSIAARHGPQQALAMQNAMYATVDEVGLQTSHLNIDCDFHMGGSVEFLRSAPQIGRAIKRIETYRSHGIGQDHIRLLDHDEAESIARISNLQGAIFDSNSAVLHPGKLVRGLAGSLRQRGVLILEGVTALSYEPGRVMTDQGPLLAGSIVRATEAFSATLPTQRRSVVPLYSLMVATEPLSDETWEEIGFDNRTSFNDGRFMIVYGQRTADNRFAFGGRGAPYHFASRIKPSFDILPTIARQLETTLLELFPRLKGTRFTHHWGGPLGATRDWNCSVSYDPRTGLAHAGGYVGDGVSTTNLAGRTLADLITRSPSDVVRLPWVGHQSRKWEPEPLRFFAINAMTRLAAQADKYEERTNKPAKLIGAMIDKLAGGS